MRYLLDTNTCIHYLNGTSKKIQKRIKATPPYEIVVCAVVKAELFYGAENSKQRQENLQIQYSFLERFISLPFDDKSAEIYGRIRTTLKKAGTPIGPNDLMIASIAIAHNCILVTHNTKEFKRIAGLELEDWEV